MKKNIALIGMPGCGKSSVGRLLSSKLKYPFYDVDQYIEIKEGMTIKEIFKNGEEFFRKIETLSLKEVTMNCPVVISTGGGVVKIPENIEILKQNSIIVFINRPIDHIAGDVDISFRPLLTGDASRIYELFKERYPLYKRYCDLEVINDKDIEDVVNKIISSITDKL